MPEGGDQDPVAHDAGGVNPQAPPDDPNAAPLVRRVLQFALLLVVTAVVVLLGALWSLV